MQRSKKQVTMPRVEDEWEIHRLCRDGAVEEVYNYLELHGNKRINISDKKGYAPIHYAVKRDNTREVEHVLSLLFTNDADVNVRSLKDGDTALHMVVQRFDEDGATCISLKLLSHGADPDYQNDSYRRAYDIAMARNMVSLAEFLTSDLSLEGAQTALDQYRAKHYGGKLTSAVMYGNKEEISSCLRQGADVDALNEHGAGAIHYVITHCPLHKLTILDQLLNAGADVNLQDYEEDTALNLVIKTASDRRRPETEALLQKLFDWDADPRIADVDGRNSIDLARQMGYTEIVNLLKTHCRKLFKRPSTRARNVNQNDDQYYDEEEKDEDYAGNHSNKKNGVCVLL